MKYRCINCGNVCEKKIIRKDSKCNNCNFPRGYLKKYNEKTNSVNVLLDNPSIIKIEEKCINCGLCKRVCVDIKDGKSCINCGKCIKVCPTGALRIKKDIDIFKEYLSNKNINLIAEVAPSVRVAIDEAFNSHKNKYKEGKLVGALRSLGFNYVFDTASIADLTVIEEVNELKNRLDNNVNIPMFTSCCPSWVKYVEIFYPELIPNLSTCKSPISMQSSIIKNFFTKEMGIKKNNIKIVSIVPCTSKKYEIKRKELSDTDLCLTTTEIIELIKDNNIKFDELEKSSFDTFMKDKTASGIIFGTSSGVMEAVLRQFNYIINKNKPGVKKTNFKMIRGNNKIKSAKIKVGKYKLNVAVINGLENAKGILEDIKKGKCRYNFIEVMTCEYGCINGAGQPKNKKILNKRKNALYKKDKTLKNKISYKNESVSYILKNYLSLNKDILHTSYIDKSDIFNKE